jgi:hypothetical protein
MKKVLTAAVVIMLWGTAASAAPVTFFGEDVNTLGDPNQVSPTNSTAAKNSFFTNLVGVGTETFDTAATPVGTTAPIAVAFPGAGTATITGGGQVATGNDGNGRYAISSPNYYLAGTINFTINFSSAIAAFGFFGVDIGDFGGQLTLDLTDSSSIHHTLTVPNTIGSGGSTSGSILYFGFFDTSLTYTSVSFNNNSGGADLFAFDNFSVGSVSQVSPAVPEPSTWAMLILGFAGIGFLAYRRKSKPAFITV